MTRFDFVSEEKYDGRQLVSKDGKWGVLLTEDTNNRLIVPTYYDWIKIEKNYRLIIIFNEKDKEVMDYEGNVILRKVKGINFIKIDNNRRIIKVTFTNGFVGLYDTKGKVIIEPKYQDIEIVNHEIAIVKRNNYYGAINIVSGFQVLEERFKYIVYRFYDVSRLFVKNKLDLWGVYNLDGENIINEVYSSYYFEGNIYMNSKASFDIFDYNGCFIKTIYGFNFEYSSKNDEIVVSKNKKQGVMNKNGEVIIEPKYDEIFPLGDGRYISKVKGQFALITNNENLTLNTYDFLSGRKDNTFFLVEKGNKRGVIDKVGKQILSTSYKCIDFYLLENGYFVVEDFSGRYGLFDLKGNKVLDFKYENIYDIEDNNVLVQFQRMIGTVSLK